MSLKKILISSLHSFPNLQVKCLVSDTCISLPQVLLVLETDSGRLRLQATDHAPQVDLELPWSHGSASYSFNGDNIMRQKVDMCFQCVPLFEALLSILIFLSHCLCVFWGLGSSAQVL